MQVNKNRLRKVKIYLHNLKIDLHYLKIDFQIVHK